MDVQVRGQNDPPRRLYPANMCAILTSSRTIVSRCYNGNLYALGEQRRGMSKDRVHPHDLVNLSLSLSKGEVDISVNAKEQGTCFKDVNGGEGKKVHFAVAFYGGNRRVMVERVFWSGKGRGPGVECFKEGEKENIGGGQVEVKRWYGGVLDARRDGPGVLLSEGGYYVGRWRGGRCEGLLAWVVGEVMPHHKVGKVR